ncbi:MAG TPA: arginine repressor [Gemmatimonadaceae bacterium]|nr:arginine repressor [Gemmatimonadaceae bacterium]
MSKADRHAVIRDLIARYEVASQEELRQLLVKRGLDVTQSTLSRDLRELRLARIPGPDGTARYAEPEGPLEESRTPALESLLPQLFVSVDGVSELILLRTLPGGAQAIAEAIDNREWPELLGTIAGDDTILMICRSAQARAKVTKRIREMAERGS